MASVLPVDMHGLVTPEKLQIYAAVRAQQVAERLEVALQSEGGVAKSWYATFEDELYDVVGDERKYLGDVSGEKQTLAAVQKAKTASDTRAIVRATEEVILNFCGFHNIKAKYISNALHFQFEMNKDKLLATPPTALSVAAGPSDVDRALFDDAEIVSAELLLRVVKETEGGELVADIFSPGPPMGKLLKLPLFAQLVLVLTNAVEAIGYQQELPHCPMAINVYASLLVENAPVMQMVEGVQQVEIMEMTKGAKRGPDVVQWVKMIKESGSVVLLDDFDCAHPGIDSEADGIKASVFTNAFHSLQVFKDGGVPAEMPLVQKEKMNHNDFRDYYCSLIPQYQPKITKVVLEGSENCMKSDLMPGQSGPPLNFGQPTATVVSAHLCQAIAKTLHALNPEIKMCRQGFRALYDDEEFDAEASAVIAKTGKSMAAARKNDCGTGAWMGQEALRRAAMKKRPMVSGAKRTQPPVNDPVDNPRAIAVSEAPVSNVVDNPRAIAASEASVGNAVNNPRAIAAESSFSTGFFPSSFSTGFFPSSFSTGFFPNIFERCGSNTGVLAH